MRVICALGMKERKGRVLWLISRLLLTGGCCWKLLSNRISFRFAIGRETEKCGCHMVSGFKVILTYILLQQ